MVKSKLPPRRGCSLVAVEPHPEKGAIKFLSFFFMVGWAFHHSREPPFSWFAQMIAWVQAMACVSCQGLDLLLFLQSYVMVPTGKDLHND